MPLIKSHKLAFNMYKINMNGRTNLNKTLITRKEFMKMMQKITMCETFMENDIY